MGLRWKGDYRAFQVEVTESFSDRKTLGQRREEVREPVRWLPKVGRRNPDSCQKEEHTRGLCGWEGLLFKEQNGGE